MANPTLQVIVKQGFMNGYLLNGYGFVNRYLEDKFGKFEDNWEILPNFSPPNGKISRDGAYYFKDF